MREDSSDVVIIGSGPTGSAYARIIRRDWPEARILMVEAGPQIVPQAGAHLDNVADLEQRGTLEILAQGGDRTRRLPISKEEWEARRAGGFDASHLRRSGLFIANDGDPENTFAGFAAANVGGMGTKWSTGTPMPAAAERVPFIAAPDMAAALAEAQRLLGTNSDPRAGDPVAAAMRDRLGAVFNAGRTSDRFVQPMPLAATPQGDGPLRYHGTDVVLGPLVDEPTEQFRILAETVCRRIVHRDGKVSGVELAPTGSDQSRFVAAGTVIVACDSLHTPQLLYASDIRPAALGRYLNDHYFVSQISEMQADAPMVSMSWIPSTENFPFSITVAPASFSTLPLSDDVVGQPVGMGVFIASDISPDNRVIFDDARRDWMGLPAISIRWRSSEADQARIEAAKTVARRISGIIGRPAPGFATMVLPVGSSLHYQGSIRMGESDDGTSVCDRNSRVWGFDNLYVAGNGVIPTMTATNPTLFSVALASIGAQQVAAARRAV